MSSIMIEPAVLPGAALPAPAQASSQADTDGFRMMLHAAKQRAGEPRARHARAAEADSLRVEHEQSTDDPAPAEASAATPAAPAATAAPATPAQASETKPAGSGQTTAVTAGGPQAAIANSAPATKDATLPFPSLGANGPAEATAANETATTTVAAGTTPNQAVEALAEALAAVPATAPDALDLVTSAPNTAPARPASTQGSPSGTVGSLADQIAEILAQAQGTSNTPASAPASQASPTGQTAVPAPAQQAAQTLAASSPDAAAAQALQQAATTVAHGRQPAASGISTTARGSLAHAIPTAGALKSLSGSQPASEQGFSQPQVQVQAATLPQVISTGATADRQHTSGENGERPAGESQQAATNGQIEPAAAPQSAAPAAPTAPAQSAAPASAPQNVAQQVIDRIVQHFQVLQRGGRSQVTLQLDPPALGRVDIRMSLHKGELGLQVIAHTPEARALLEAQAGQLQTALQDQGLRLNGFTLSMGQHGSSTGGQAQPHRPTPLPLPVLPEEVVMAGPAPGRLSGSSRIDYLA